MISILHLKNITNWYDNKTENKILHIVNTTEFHTGLPHSKHTLPFLTFLLTY